MIYTHTNIIRDEEYKNDPMTKQLIPISNIFSLEERFDGNSVARKFPPIVGVLILDYSKKLLNLWEEKIQSITKE